MRRERDQACSERAGSGKIVSQIQSFIAEPHEVAECSRIAGHDSKAPRDRQGGRSRLRERGDDRIAQEPRYGPTHDAWNGEIASTYGFGVTIRVFTSNSRILIDETQRFQQHAQR